MYLSLFRVNIISVLKCHVLCAKSKYCQITIIIITSIQCQESKLNPKSCELPDCTVGYIMFDEIVGLDWRDYITILLLTGQCVQVKICI